jgi:ketosteroid isomerase-like protein
VTQVLDITEQLVTATSGIDLVAAFRDGDGSHITAVFEDVVTEDFEVCMFDPSGIPNCREGVDGYVRLWREWTDAFERFSYTPTEPPRANGDLVVNFVEQRGTIRGSDAEVTAEGAAVWSYRDGRLARIDFHIDREAALRAAGLED